MDESGVCGEYLKALTEESKGSFGSMLSTYMADHEDICTTYADGEAMIKKLVEVLDLRFYDLDEGVKKATGIMNLESWPDDQDAMKGFSEAEVKTTCKHFSVPLQRADAPMIDIIAEWRILRKQLPKMTDWRKLGWGRINALFADSTPKILILFDLLLTIPVSSAESYDPPPAVSLWMASKRRKPTYSRKVPDEEDETEELSDIDETYLNDVLSLKDD
ncbi:hypothetical protein CAPTEDRAFT_209569 [Capitella teleta]|uniref:Uncharacterized protein n=1 Tax=Capitella teleta TaxID=283909 RepID=R7VJ17_CAPTE|nr:hypothetical protein CAPTEDRAFT_209569 [Capitella teleta]|eukprot:ELU18557.1 hypothetical protein CAPTEDRAFT_209569 [Capitella teleta]